MISFLSRDEKHNNLWKLLEQKHRLPKESYRQALQAAKEGNRHIAEVLFEIAEIPHDKLLETVAKYFNLPPVLLRKKIIVPYVLKLIPKEVAEQHSVIIFKKIGKDIYVALTNPDNEQTINFIKKKTGLNPKLFITSPQEIQRAVKKYREEIVTEFSKIIENAIENTLEHEEPAEKLAQNVPIIKMVDAILEHALQKKSSDIHIEPTSEDIVIRFRIDGLLNRVLTLPLEILPPLITRIKIMAQLKIDEHRVPQDGRFKYFFQDRDVAIRTSVIPTLNGPKLVLRLLDIKERDFTLARLGLNPIHSQIMKQEILKPQGMILVTGPTGSGKTTTLYALLRMLNKEEINISTIEDPIEYGIEGINQTQINPVAGLTFANGLRSLLRQDPNVLMVGEIRDSDTANISLNAALTGHLVLSTLHTNNAFQAIQRLTEMGVQPYLAATVTNAIIGQRLVRKICPFCKVRTSSTPKLIEQFSALLPLEKIFQKLKHLGLTKTAAINEINFYRGQGCERCNNYGYLGRLGIYEILPINKQMRDLILENPTADKIYNQAMAQGILTMAEDGVLKVLEGETTFDEVLRVTKE
ncbi:MAG: GspE/PulE family protein [Patescibacteria group bacterium]|nr:GspE/PulE family protein [Patescibacteria group bacterium]MDD5715242.1 GspE/PulE family protein [Patescibacteria group bacterium]